MDEDERSPVAIVRAVIAALNRGDIDAVLACCADDIVLWAPGAELNGQEVRGKEQLRQALEAGEDMWPDTWMAIRSIVASGDSVAVELVTAATECQHYLVQPMAAFYTVRDGLIVSQRNYYDLGALRFAAGASEID